LMLGLVVNNIYLNYCFKRFHFFIIWMGVAFLGVLMLKTHVSVFNDQMASNEEHLL
jgi:hypothetical protein